MSIGHTKLAVVPINHCVLKIFIYLFECETSPVDNSSLNSWEPMFQSAKSKIYVVDAVVYGVDAIVNVTQNSKQHFLDRGLN